MHIAVTGSSGLIGSALVPRLRAGGHEVTRVVRSASPSSTGETIGWDPTAGTIDTAGFEGVDAVVHLAGAGIGDKRWSEERKKVILESRTKSTELLTRTLAGLDRPPAVLLSGSAIGFYGERGDEVLTETSPRGHDFLSDVVVAWEAAAQPAVDAGIRTAFLRTGVVLSRDGGALGKLLPLFRFGVGGKLGKGDQWWSWISVDDEIGAIEFLLTADVSGPVNLTAPEPVTNAALTKALGSVLGRPTVVPVPKFGPKLLLGAELGDALLFTSARIQPEVLTAAGYTFRHRDITGALRSLLGKAA